NHDGLRVAWLRDPRAHEVSGLSAQYVMDAGNCRLLRFQAVRAFGYAFGQVVITIGLEIGSETFANQSPGLIVVERLVCGETFLTHLGGGELEIGRAARVVRLLSQSLPFIVGTADQFQWRWGQAVFGLDLSNLLDEPFELHDAVYAAVFTRKVLASQVTIDLTACGPVRRQKAEEIAE